MVLDALAQVLSLIMWPCYNISGNWWIAILLFTVIVKVILLPMSLWCQKNSIVMVQLMPDLNRIKVKYFGDAETIGEKQNELYKEKHYHPLLSLIPLAVQILILFGLVEVIHMITDTGMPGTELLGLIPVEDGGIAWVWPLLAGLSAVVMGFAQNRINPLQKEQSRAEKNMTNGLSIALSFFLGIFVAAGMAFYWICSNLTSIAIQALCNIIIKPRKYIDYEDLEESRVALNELNSLSSTKGKWYKPNPLAKREKADYKRFFNVVNKHIVFFAEGGGFYRYFQGAIEYLLANSDATLHYITTDPDDKVFQLAEKYPRIRPYYIGEKKLITLMMKMDCDVFVASLEDLENFYLKRSYIRKDIEYVFMFHHMTSTHLVSRKGAFDHYDTLLCVGQHQIDELRRAEEIYQLPKKRLVPCGYDLIDRTIANVAALPAERHARPVAVIAPSWQEDNILDSCADELIGSLLAAGFRVIVRPHPEYKKRYRARWDALCARWEHAGDEAVHFERDFGSNTSVFTSDVLITDWSSVWCEFSYSTLKPCIFINTPMKVTNPDYQELGMVPTDVSLRDEVGVSVAVAAAGTVGGIAAGMMGDLGSWRQRIEAVRAAHVFNLGQGGAVAGEYLLSRMLEIQELKRVQNDVMQGGEAAKPAKHGAKKGKGGEKHAR